MEQKCPFVERTVAQGLSDPSTAALIRNYGPKEAIDRTGCKMSQGLRSARSVSGLSPSDCSYKVIVRVFLFVVTVWRVFAGEKCETPHLLRTELSHRRVFVHNNKYICLLISPRCQLTHANSLFGFSKRLCTFLSSIQQCRRLSTVFKTTQSRANLFFQQTRAAIPSLNLILIAFFLIKKQRLINTRHSGY